MNLVADAPIWLVGIFAAAMIAAAVEDMVRLRISNLTSIAVFASAIIAAAIEGPSWALWHNLVVFVAILALGTAAFAAEWLGGGDVKLFAAAAFWFDFRTAVWFVAIVFLCGGVVAALYLVSRPLRRNAGSLKGRGRVPYGAAIALGALTLIFLQQDAVGHHVSALPPVRISPDR